MKKNWIIVLALALAIPTFTPTLAGATNNAGDFGNTAGSNASFGTSGSNGGLAVGSGYALTDDAPTNGMIVQGEVGIGSTAPVVSLDLSQESDALALPSGLSSTRPVSAALTGGEIRYNTGLTAVEYYNGSTWQSLQASGSSSGLYLGSSSTAPNPAASSSDTQTGLYTAGAGKVDFTSAGTPIVEISTTGAGPTIAAAGTGTNVNLTISPKGTGNTLVPTGSVGIGTASPIVSLDLSQETNALALPVGTTGQRSTGSALTNGEIRYNSTTQGIEAYVNGAWISLGTTTSGNRVLISSTTASNQASVTITDIGSTYNRYELVLLNISPVTNGVNLIMTPEPTGGTYTLTSSGTVGNNDWGVNAVMTCYAPWLGDATFVTTGTYPSTSGSDTFFSNSFLANYDGGAATTSLVFTFSSGNISSGTFLLYGIVN